MKSKRRNMIIAGMLSVSMALGCSCFPVWAEEETEETEFQDEENEQQNVGAEMNDADVGLFAAEEENALAAGESSENIIKLISLFARDIEHDKTYMSEIYDYIEKNQYDNMNFANKLL